MANGTLAASQIEMLSQSGTGIITITPPATNTNRTITLPDATATLFTNAGGTMTGDLTVASAGTRKVSVNRTNAATAGAIEMISGDSQNVLSSTGAKDIGVEINGTEIVRFNSGGGIQFPSTQLASANANTLDDYEEGTWTPTDTSGASLSLSNTSGNCFYTKVGRTVTVTFRLTYPSTASGSVAVIGGLPFLSIDTSVNVQSICFGEQNFSAGAMGLVQDNATTFLFLTTNGSSVTVHTNANVSTKDFRGTATYQSSS